MTKERSRNVYPFLGRPQLHFQDGGGTWKTINKNGGMLFSSEARWRSSEGDLSLGARRCAVMIQMHVTNQGEGDRRDITSPEGSP